jgi:two-component system, cell cycle sensor histidine kinase and response regulator CckA
MKILHLEDNPADAELVSELLHEQWPECEITVASTRQDYLTAITGGDFDLVLSDFSLGQFNGLEALQLARELRPHTPFVFLSGNIGEDRAIEAVRQGAQDYVLKDRMKRLVTALQRALRDSQERKRLHVAEEDRQRLAAILETTPDFVGMASPNGELLYLNRAARAMIGLPDGPLPPGFSVRDIHTPAAEEQLREHIPVTLRDGSWSGESELLTLAGRVVPVSEVLLAHHAPDGSVAHFSAVMRDLTVQKRSEALVNGQKQVLEMIAGGSSLPETLASLLRFIESQAPDLYCSILLLDDTGQRLRVSAAPRLPAAYLQAIDNLPIGPEAGSCGTAAYRRARVNVTDIATDPRWEPYRHLALRHGLRACWSTPIFDLDNHLLGTFAVYEHTPGEPTPYHLQLIEAAQHLAAISISRHQAERRLRDQADLLNKARDAIIVFDPDRRITFWNSGAERIFGWSASEAIGHEERDLLGEEALTEIESVRQAMRNHEEWEGIVPLHDKLRRPITIECRFTVIRDNAGQPQGRLVIATDITAKKRIEEQFLRAQRLESIGMLAAGIAHDLNNVLAPILLAAPMLRDHIADPGDLPLIEALEKSAERGAALVRQILSFAHGADGEHQLIQPKHILRDLAGFIEQTFPKTIRLQEHLPSNLWTVRANLTQLHQVILNLCVNARDAMPQGGTLTLVADNCVLDDLSAAAIEGARPGGYVVLQVEDTGTGIPPEILAHIWEPFFTTKSAGKGTGLGLSTVRGIVENHAGFITVRTAPGHGTTFRVYLHAAECSAQNDGGPPTTGLPPRGGGELILVVDDELNVRKLTATILAHHGYRVLTAGDGAEALALFTPRSEEIRLVVTDLAMPNLDGIGLARLLRRRNPAVRILITSGLAAEGQPRPPEDFAPQVLMKPFKSETLLDAVHALLHPGIPPA